MINGKNFIGNIKNGLEQLAGRVALLELVEADVGIRFGHAE